MPSFPPGVHPANTHPLFIVVFFQMLFQSIRNGKHVDAVICGAAVDDSTADVLQTEWLHAMNGVGKQGLEEHARVGILVVFQKACYCGCMEDTGVMHVKAKIVIPLFDACVQRAAVASKADRKEVVFLSRVSEEESALGLPF